MRNVFTLLLLTFAALPALSQAEEGTEPDPCVIKEIIDLGTANIDSLKGKAHEQGGLFGGDTYWDVTRKLLNTPGTVNYFSIGEEYYIEYKVEQYLTQEDAQSKAALITATFLDCLGNNYGQREVKPGNDETFEVYDIRDKDALIYHKYPYVKVEVVSEYGSSNVEVTLYFPDKE